MIFIWDLVENLVWITYSLFLDAFSHLYKRVCPSVIWSVRPSVGRSHASWNPAKVPFSTKITGSTSENASYAVYTALLISSLVVINQENNILITVKTQSGSYDCTLRVLRAMMLAQWLLSSVSQWGVSFEVRPNRFPVQRQSGFHVPKSYQRPMRWGKRSLAQRNMTRLLGAQSGFPVARPLTQNTVCSRTPR